MRLGMGCVKGCRVGQGSVAGLGLVCSVKEMVNGLGCDQCG